MHVCVCINMFSSAVDKEKILSIFNILCSIDSESPSTVRYSKDTALFCVLPREEKTLPIKL